MASVAPQPCVGRNPHNQVSPQAATLREGTVRQHVTVWHAVDHSLGPYGLGVPSVFFLCVHATRRRLHRPHCAARTAASRKRLQDFLRAPASLLRRWRDADADASQEKAGNGCETRTSEKMQLQAAETNMDLATDAATAGSFRVVKKPLSGQKGNRSPKNIDHLLLSNQKWRETTEQALPEYFEMFGRKHAPTYMWIGCADARITADRIIDVAQGDMFVARNVANLVVHTDVNLMSAVTYAVDVLEVEHIIVCGHYDCGGVKASLLNVDHQAPLENWLRNIRDVRRMHFDELEAIKDPVQKQHRLVELNVQEQTMNLFKTGLVQKRRVFTATSSDFSYTQPRLHAVVYDPADGILKELAIDWAKILKENAAVYNLYQLPEE